MVASVNKKNVVKGPVVYENWRASLEKKDALDIFEYPLFSDAKVTGSAAQEGPPYLFMNQGSADEYLGYFRPVIYVRVYYYLEFKVPDMSSTDTESFHGGTLVDEIAALVSLALGIRIKAGKRSRDCFHSDPQGRPVGWIRQPEFLNSKYQSLVIPCAVLEPHAIREPPLSLLSIISSIPVMKPRAANALIKAARSYQRAMLIVEEDASMAWLFFVTAIEKAANYWMATRGSKLNVFKELNPKLYERLEKFEESEELRSIIAEEFYNQLGSKKKFLGFLLSYLPKPPTERPDTWGQIAWDRDSMKSSFDTIYKHRCEALHEGTPFPSPMCDPPMREREGNKVWHEKPPGSACSSSGGTWVEKDLPMCLNIFEYIVRMALLKWWQELGV